MAKQTPSDSVTFRHIPGALLLSFSLGTFFLYGSYLIIADPDLWSPKGLLLMGLGIAGNYFVWTGLIIIWWNYWRYTVTPTHLIAVHWYRRKRVAIPWEAIVAVRKRPRPWWERGGHVRITEIETADRQRVTFTASTMLHYSEFLQELKARAVNCRSFDAYRHAYDR